MKLFRIMAGGIAAACFAAGTVHAQDEATAIQEAADFEEMIQSIIDGTAADTATHRQRMQAFRQALAQSRAGT